MQKVWIFGDSYADPVHKDNDSWPLQLEKRYEVKNFALIGTGPNLQIKKFLDEIKSTKDTSDVSVIFFISDVNRHNFRFLKEYSHSTYMINVVQNDQGIDKKSKRHIKEYGKKYGEFLKSFFYNYWLHNDLHYLEFLKFIGLLKDLSPLFKKIIAINIFEDLDKDAFQSQIIKNSNHSSNNFYFAKGSRLYDYELMVNTYEPNHMCKDNHDIMYKELSNWIDSSINLDLDKLKKIR
jgi:hypothetical protein